MPFDLATYIGQVPPCNRPRSRLGLGEAPETYTTPRH
eukprot:gene9980-8857_t